MKNQKQNKIDIFDFIVLEGGTWGQDIDTEKSNEKLKQFLAQKLAENRQEERKQVKEEIDEIIEKYSKDTEDPIEMVTQFSDCFREILGHLNKEGKQN